MSPASMGWVPSRRDALRHRFESQTPDSARSVILRGLASFVLVWQALWLAADPDLWPTSQESAAAVAMTSLVFVSWLAFATAHITGRRRAAGIAGSVNALTAAAAALVILWSSGSDMGPAANMVLLAVGLAGLTFAMRVSLIAIVAVVGAEVLAIAAESTATDWMWLTPAFAGVVAVVSTSARYLLVQAADRTDAAIFATWSATRQRREVEALDIAANQQARLLHDTVLNTLTAIERGGLEASANMRERLRERCRQEAEILRSASGLNTSSELPHPASIINAEVDAVIVDLMSRGIVVTAEGDSLSNLPEDVYLAINNVNLEALRNVSRHAHASSVSARIVLDEGPPVRVIDEIVDDGVGFAPDEVVDRFGIERSIKQSMTDVGGVAEVISAPGAGTTVRATWVGGVPRARRLAPLTPVFAIPVLGAACVYGGLVQALGLDAGTGWTVADRGAFALFLALAIVLAVAALLRSVNWWVIATIALISPLVFVWQADTQGTAAPVDWSSAVLNMLFLVAIALGPRYAWLVLIPVWLLLQGAPAQELVSSGTAVLVAGAIFSRSLRRNSARYEDQLRLREQEQVESGLAQTRVIRSRRRYRALRASGAMALLEGIASGAIDPADDQARARAALEERFIRTVLRVDPWADRLHSVVTTLAIEARQRGVILEVKLSDSNGVRADEVDAARPSWLLAVWHAIPGEVARFTAQREGDRLVARLVVPVEPGERAAMSGLHVPWVVADPLDPSDHHVILESSFAYEAADVD